MNNFDNYTKDDFIKLYDRPLTELLEIANKITAKNFNNEVEACSIISAKTGACSENCKDEIDAEEILKTICIFRIILPKAMLRYAGGRCSRLSKFNQKRGLIAGINSILVGTTLGSNADEDKETLKELDLTLV